MKRGINDPKIRISFLFLLFLIFCLIISSVSAQDVNTAISEDVTIEVKDSSVLLNGMNIAEKAKGQSYVSSNLMVTYSMGSGKVASTASVPSKYSSTGALIQSDLGDGKNWYYLKEINKGGEDVFEGKEKVTVIWGGNGDAQPPEGATYHGTMQNGEWTDGGPPQIS